MNPHDFKSFLMDILQSPDKVTNLEEVLQKGLVMYKEMTETLKQATPEERLRIQNSLAEVQQFFNQQLEMVAGKMGISKEELLSQIKNPSNYAPVAWDSIRKFEGEVEKEKRSLMRAMSSPQESGGLKKPLKKRNRMIVTV